MDEKTTLQSTNHQNITIRSTGDLHGNSISCTQALTTDSLSQCPVSGSCNVPQPPTILSSDLCELACKFEGESLIKVDTMLAEPCEYLEEVSVFDVDADDGGERSHPGLVDGSVELDESVPTLAEDRSGHSEKTLVGDDSPDEDDGHQTLKEVSLRGNEESKDARMNLLDATPFLMSEGGVIFQCFPLSEKDFFIVSLEDDTLLMNEPLTEDHLSIAAEAPSDMRVGNLGEDSIKQGGHITVGTEVGSGPHFPSLEGARVDEGCIQNIPTSSLMTSSYNNCESSYDDPQETRVATSIISSEIAGPSTDFGSRSQFVTANTTDSVVMARRKIKAPVLKDDEQPQKELMKVTHATIYASAPRRMRKAPTDNEEISSEMYKCFVCNDALPTSLTLRHHLVTKHQQSNFDSFMCFLCEQECWSASQEEWHLRIQHSIKNKALACPVCGTQFSIQTECRAHIRKHSVNLTCPSCPQKFAAQHQLTHHVKQHLEEIQPYSCLQCDIRFTHPRVLEIHMWRHRSQNCPEDSCAYAAEDESWLMYHLQDHHKYTAQSVRSLVAARNSADYKMDVLLLKYYQIQKDKLKSQSSDARGLRLTASEVHASGERNSPLMSSIEKNDSLAGKLLKDTSECDRDERVNDSSSVLGDILETVVITQEEKKKNVKRKEEVLRKVFDGGTSMHRCGLCNTYHSSLEELAVHKAEHNQVLECIKCQRSFLSVKQLKRHMTVHNSSKDDQKQPNKDKGMNEHRCLVCGKMYGSESALSRHSSIHGRSEGHHQCKICLRRVRTKAHLTEHMSRVHKAHSDSEKVQCSMCNGKFSSNFHLSLHVMNHEETKPLYSCKTCNRSYIRPRSLRRHMDAHSQTFVCDTCDETFPSAHRLAVHARGHDPLYKSKVPCPRCPATFPYKSQMEVHLRTHTGEKPYVCETCGKCFKRLQHCKTHHKVMHGNEKLPCLECGKPFTDKTNLLRHRLKVHYHLNRWVCGVCAQSYAYSADLRHHLKRKHDVEFQRLDHAYKKCMSEVYVIPELGTQEISKSTRAAIEYICEIERQKVKQIYSGIVPDLKRPVQKKGNWK